MKKNKSKYSIGELADYFNISTDTLRLYDKIGILSPEKNESTRYRIYNREDFICLEYVMRLRKLEIPLQEIKALVNESSLINAEAMLRVQEDILVNRIKELEKLRLIVQDYRKSFSNAIQNIDKITIKESPLLLMKPVGDNITEVIDSFSKLTEVEIPKFTFVAKPDLFHIEKMWEDIKITKENKSFLEYSFTLIDDEELSKHNDLEKMGFQIVEPRMCVHAVVKATTNKDYSGFARIKNYMKEHNLPLGGDSLHRLISVRAYDICYYDCWTPIG